LFSEEDDASLADCLMESYTLYLYLRIPDWVSFGLTRDSKVSEQVIRIGSIEEIIDDVGLGIFPPVERRDIFELKGGIQSTALLQRLYLPILRLESIGSGTGIIWKCRTGSHGVLWGCIYPNRVPGIEYLGLQMSNHKVVEEEIYIITC
jgi:hypothetical protein